MTANQQIASKEGREQLVLARNQPCLADSPSGQNMVGARCRLRQRGFTIIELMIVLAIITILMGIAIPMYQRSLVRARESVLREDLYTMRNAIDQYTLDKQTAPQTLQDLASAGYLKTIPKDPMTNSDQTWVPEMEDALRSIDQQQPGIADVHSGSDQTGSEGTPYNTW